MLNNPFKFGSIVDDPYFTDRREEIKMVSSVLNSSNHLILISPRRYGKSSLIYKAVQTLNRPIIAIDLQLITTIEDFAAHLLKRIYRLFPAEKIKQFIQNFRIIPAIALNPITNEVDISFKPSAEHFPVLEDVLNLIEKLSDEKKRIIVILDEFQEVNRLNPDLNRQLRSIMQLHQLINYIFLGSQESMMKDIFEKKKSAFYHFGFLLTLGKINHIDFANYLEEGFNLQHINSKVISDEILKFTKCHPYYTQQLAFMVWERLTDNADLTTVTKQAIDEIIQIHDMDFERLWGTFNKTDQKLLIGIAETGLTPLSEAFYRKYDLGAPSTVFSSLKRVMKNGYIIKSGNKHELDDPFFSNWIINRRNY